MKMYDFTAPLFWFKFVFLVEILVAEALIIYRMKRRGRFALRLTAALVLLVAFTFALPVPFYNAAYSSLLFMLHFTATLGALKFCFDEPWGSIIFCGFYSYNQQHIAFQFYNLLCLALGINANNNIYGGEMGDFGDGLQIFVFIVPHIAVYLICWAIMAYRANRNGNGELYLKNFKMLIIAVSIVFVNVVLNAFVVYDLPSDISIFVNFIIIFYNLFACILALGMLVSVVGQEKLESELKIMENLWRKNEQIYELSKVNVDFINMKCHDLRHRIRNAREKDFTDKDELREIEYAIDIYDGILKTGNEVLDVVLSEESIFCAKHEIKLLCNIDGAQMNFMQQADIYSIIQNAIHNAIDAVLKLQSPEKRVIRVNVKRINNIISVHIENYTDNAENIRFENGLPVTSQRDRDVHGFGMRSIKASVEKYGGGLIVDVKEGIFNLDIMIPVPVNNNSGEQKC